MPTDDSDERETFTSPACSMHEFERDPVPRSAARRSDRRRFLRMSLTGLGAIGAFFGSIPFVRSFLPSARARALGNPVAIDVSDLEPGAVKPCLYRGETMLVLRRTKEMLATLAITDELQLDTTPDPDYSDPSYVNRVNRAIDPEFLVVRGVCTHLGCVPQLKGKEGKQILGEWWPGGFICPCHQSGYDYAGRVIRGPAPRNLPVPPHRFATPTRIVIGEPPAPT